jgi:hypothetical protein
LAWRWTSTRTERQFRTMLYQVLFMFDLDVQFFRRARITRSRVPQSATGKTDPRGFVVI